MNLNNRLQKLKELMISYNLDGFLVPRSDMFSGEEVPENEERLKYISGFSGSSGFGIISSNINIKSAIFSDGRYKLQLKKEVDPIKFDCFEGGINEIGQFLIKYQNFFINLAIDPWLLTLTQYNNLKKQIQNNKINIIYLKSNLIDEIWLDNKLELSKTVYELSTDYTGKKRSSKIMELTQTIKDHGGDYYILFRPTGLAWLLNIRGNDLKHTPVLRSFCIISKTGEVLIFTDNNNIEGIFIKDNTIKIYNFNEFTSFIQSIKKKIFLIDDQVLPFKLYEELKRAKLVVKNIFCPVEKSKSIKNIVELKGMRSAHLKDGVAFIKLLFWFEKKLKYKDISESSIVSKLLEIRSLEKTFVCESFATISAFADNGAIIHYKVTKLSDKKIHKDGLYLLDTGGHYLEGTTDTTRTILVGKAEPQMIKDFTLVLKGHIALSRTVFPIGTKGRDLDAIARKSLWLEGKDYAHGTGHGVGCFLSVHEGPISISKNSDCIIENGMVISNEPGYYLQGKYGIRIENLEVVSQKKFSGDINNFLCFENLTRVPLDLNLIDKNLLNENEINWVNNYHNKIYKDLSEMLKNNDEELLDFLKLKTSKI